MDRRRMRTSCDRLLKLATRRRRQRRGVTSAIGSTHLWDGQISSSANSPANHGSPCCSVAVAPLATVAPNLETGSRLRSFAPIRKPIRRRQAVV